MVKPITTLPTLEMWLWSEKHRLYGQYSQPRHPMWFSFLGEKNLRVGLRCKSHSHEQLTAFPHQDSFLPWITKKMSHSRLTACTSYCKVWSRIWKGRKLVCHVPSYTLSSLPEQSPNTLPNLVNPPAWIMPEINSASSKVRTLSLHEESMCRW